MSHDLIYTNLVILSVVLFVVAVISFIGFFACLGEEESWKVTIIVLAIFIVSVILFVNLCVVLRHLDAQWAT